MVNIFFDSVQVDDYIVEVEEARFSLIFSEVDFEVLLKRCSSVCHAGGHAGMLVGYGVRDKRCCWSIFPTDMYPHI